MKIKQKLLAQKIIKIHQAIRDNLGVIANNINLEDKFWKTHESHKATFIHLAEVANIPISPVIYCESMRHFALNYSCQSTDNLNLKHQANIDSVNIWLDNIKKATN